MKPPLLVALRELDGAEAVAGVVVDGLDVRVEDPVPAGEVAAFHLPGNEGTWIIVQRAVLHRGLDAFAVDDGLLVGAGLHNAAIGNLPEEETAGGLDVDANDVADVLLLLVEGSNDLGRITGHFGK